MFILYLQTSSHDDLSIRIFLNIISCADGSNIHNSEQGKHFTHDQSIIIFSKKDNNVLVVPEPTRRKCMKLKCMNVGFLSKDNNVCQNPSMWRTLDSSYPRGTMACMSLSMFIPMCGVCMYVER